jgi:hypothetical protein
MPKSHSPETYRSGNPLFNVPEEIDDDDLEELLEEEGLYLGALPLVNQLRNRNPPPTHRFLHPTRPDLCLCAPNFPPRLAPRRFRSATHMDH